MKVHIKEPCSEDWSKMKIGLLSRHCDVCDKSVFDFTQKSREEIIIHLLSNPNERVCGRMNHGQFDFHHEDIPILIEALRKRPVNSSFLVLTLVCLSLVSCSSDNGAIKTKDPIDQRTLGEVIPPKFTDSTKQSNESKPKSPETIRQEGEPISGDVVYLPPPEVLSGDVVLESPPVPMGEPDFIENSPGDKPLAFAEKMPEYDGGMDAMFNFIQKNVHYPDYEKDNNIEGIVYVKVTIDEFGNVTSPKIMRSVSGAQNFNKEVIRVVNLMPKWIPGENNGKKVAVESVLPFRFKLQ